MKNHPIRLFIMHFSSHLLWLCTLMLTIIPWGLSAQPPILLELFTSQSCEDCPKADALVEHITQKNPHIITLSCPVDYWNYSGWKDTLSRGFCTKRQVSYSTTIAPQRTLNTPEFIINGRETLKGNDVFKLSNLLARTKTPIAPISLDYLDEDRLHIRIPAMKLGAHKAKITLLLYGPSQTVAIRGGVLRGKKVTYTHPVQTIDILHPAWEGDAVDTTINLGKERMERARGAVVLVHKGQRSTGKILALGHIQ
ncbi:MAG: DUF1223 domain-containing protein [Alphaproteobacteria bacterium]|nr:MAG: DUF1223 domain-containing protein [Alphaproteobacteria bacterium]TAF16020.1 MAG: DUF1223 domain-containing protein [Alphaproteobacteria bacterium]TAF76207.1 MAG: DUF1223 domain-containing protein [Alphaproteobacteria bacterium]